MLLFFFFFKQKTAYEMRISDWSSDVCSSDLRVAAAAVGLTARALPGACRAVFAAIRHGCAAERWPGPAAGIVTRRATPRREGEHRVNHNKKKIGRASCRERVCQYV